ncbi:hypothetical protein ACHAW5_001757 [Stephanodiscus triporus]|uniref:Glycosyltransferase family 92 protein n=1 Tax=Stephanodiscus triporus TaxID=2934178 RepID=A0ABD3MLD9_9STRA
MTTFRNIQDNVTRRASVDDVAAPPHQLDFFRSRNGDKRPHGDTSEECSHQCYYQDATMATGYNAPNVNGSTLCSASSTYADGSILPRLQPSQLFLSKKSFHNRSILLRMIAAVMVSGFVAVNFAQYELFSTYKTPRLERICGEISPLDQNFSRYDPVDQLVSKYNITKSSLNCGGQILKLNQDPPWDHDEGLAVLCCIAVEEGPYISEFVDYHLGLGFGKIVVYDNSNSFELEEWGKSYNGRVETIHFPGPGQQQRAYLNCAKKALSGTFGEKKWAAFFDVDEFLVLKRHENVEALLEEHLSEGSLSINWIMFPSSGELFCEPLPVTKRFVYPDLEINKHVKSIVRLQDMNMTRKPTPHFPYLNGNLTQHDTSNVRFTGPFNKNGPTDVAVIHHYHTKSYGEYVMKRYRGASSDTTVKLFYAGALNDAIMLFERAINKCNQTDELTGRIFDDSAWTTLKKVSPKYARYENK